MATRTDLSNFIDQARARLEWMKEQSENSVEQRAMLLTQMAQLRAEMQSAQYKLENNLFAEPVSYKPRHQFIRDVLNDLALDRLAAEAAWQNRYDDGFTSL